MESNNQNMKSNNNQSNNDTESSSFSNADASISIPPPAANPVDQNPGGSTNNTLTSSIPFPDFSVDQDLDSHSSATTLTSATPQPNFSPSSMPIPSNYKPPSPLSVAKSNKLPLDLQVYDAIIQNDIPTLAKILTENPNYYLNLPIKVKDIDNNVVGGDADNDIHRNDKAPLMIAASLDYVDVVKYLLKNPNIEIDLQDEQGATALFQAAAAGNSDVVKVLLRNFAAVDLSNNQDLSPLMIAAYHGHTYVCRMMLDRGKASVNKKDKTGKSALAHAAHRGHAQTVETLLGRGADFNITDEFNWTPMMLAAYTGQANIVRQLLLAGADRSLETTNGKTAATLARDGGFIHVADMIDNFASQTYKSRAITMRDSYIEKGQGLNDAYNPETRRLSYRVSGRPSAMDWNQRRQRMMSEDSRRVSTSSRLRLEMEPRKKNTLWVYTSWVVTAPFLDRFLISIGGMDDARSRQAWREKITMCFFIALASAMVALITLGLATLACREPPPIPDTVVDSFWASNSSATTSRVMIVRGKIYNVGDYFNLGFHRPLLPNMSDSTLSPIINPLFGRDVSQFFPSNDLETGCQFAPSNRTGSVLCPYLPQNDSRYHCHSSRNSVRTLESLSTGRFVGVSFDEIYGKTGNRKLLVFNNFVYDFTSYLDPSNTNHWLGNNGTSTKLWIQSLIGVDATKEISGRNNGIEDGVVGCFEQFRVGRIEGVVYECAAVSTIVIVLTTITSLFGIMKLLSAFAFDFFISKKIMTADKKPHGPRRMLVLIPCYSEGKEGIKMSLDSLSAADYSDQHKLLFVVADGDITGSGETMSTPEIIKDLIVPFEDVDRSPSTGNTPPNSGSRWKEPIPRSYIAIGQGTKRHNMAQVYAGYYLYENRRIPTILVVKCGTPAERKLPKAGNRGKRDTQLVLMNLLYKAYYNEAMTELEFEMFEKIRLITGVTVDQYELMCMVDADTIVEESSLGVMVACMDRDPRVVGICGETKILNKTDNWVTMIQVFEYYISHHLGKTFESVYAGVTCLPGCFCMYRVYAYNHDGLRVPIILDSDVMKNYSTNDVDTFHQKNLLLLGEDRYLTTLILRAFPQRKTLYCPSAVCLTAVPTSFSVLVSQRRRWINGTVHNLLELIVAPELPGRFCCSMQFVAFLDFIGTVTAPFTTFYFFSLVIAVLVGKPLGLQLAFSTVTYLVQFALVVFTSLNPVYIMWFAIYAFSTPLWFAILPLYAFWNFDDFSWGTTRKIEGVDNGHDEDTIFDKFDPRKVEFKKWDEWLVYRQLHNLPMIAPLPQPSKPSANTESAYVPMDEFDFENQDGSQDGETNVKDESQSTQPQPSATPNGDTENENGKNVKNNS